MIKRLLFLAAVMAALCSCGSVPEESIRPTIDLNRVLTNEMSDSSVLAPMERKIANYMSQWQLQGAQLVIMRNDSLMYAKGFGWADKEQEEPMGPGNIMRVASVSKLITATGIMVLQVNPADAARLNLRAGDKVMAENAYGSAEFSLKLSDRVAPGTAVSEGVWWQEYTRCGNTNRLTSSRTTDKAAGSTFYDVRINLRPLQKKTR